MGILTDNVFVLNLNFDVKRTYFPMEHCIYFKMLTSKFRYETTDHHILPGMRKDNNRTLSQLHITLD